MLNWRLIKSPHNWFIVVLMVLLAQLFFEFVTNSTGRDCGCNH